MQLARLVVWIILGESVSVVKDADKTIKGFSWESPQIGVKCVDQTSFTEIRIGVYWVYWDNFTLDTEQSVPLFS